VERPRRSAPPAAAGCCRPPTNTSPQSFVPTVRASQRGRRHEAPRLRLGRIEQQSQRALAPPIASAFLSLPDTLPVEDLLVIFPHRPRTRTPEVRLPTP